MKAQNFTVRKLLLVAVLSALGIFAVYQMKFKPVPAVPHTIALEELRGEIMGTGTLNTHYKAAASPKMFQGRLVAVFADQSDFVTNGQLLARLDDSEQQRQVEMSQAALEAAQATARRVRDDEARAHAVLKLARLEFDRVSSLFTNRIASASDHDSVMEQLHVAEAGLAVAQSAILEAERQQVAAEKQLAYQKELLADTMIPAPFNGLVVKRNHDPGDVVTPGASILDVVDTNEVWVSAWVDETAMAPLRTNQPARVVFRSERSKAYSGRVARLGRQTDPETREFVVDVLLSELPANWTMGQRAEVYIETACSAGTLALPAGFLVWRDGQAGVLVNERGWARWKTVQLGVRGRESFEVLSGLASGDQVLAPAEGANALKLESRRILLQPVSTPGTVVGKP